MCAFLCAPQLSFPAAPVALLAAPFVGVVVALVAEQPQEQSEWAGELAGAVLPSKFWATS